MTRLRLCAALALLFPMLSGGICANPPFTITVTTPTDGITTCKPSLDVEVTFSRAVDPAIAGVNALLVEGLDSTPIPSSVGSAFTIESNRATATIPLTTEGKLFLSVNVDENGDGQSEDFKTLTMQRVVLGAAPQIDLVSPSAGAIGSQVFITGDGFCPSTEDTQVTINGDAATVLEASSTAVLAEVPNTTSGALGIAVPGFSALGPDFAIDAAFAPIPSTAADRSAGFRIGELIIAYDPVPSPTELASINSTFGIESQQYFPDGNYFVARLLGANATQTVAMADALEVRSDVVLAALNVFGSAFSLPDEPRQDDQSHLEDIGFRSAIPSAWADVFPNQGAGIVIGVFDTGIDTSEITSGIPSIFMTEEMLGVPNIPFAAPSLTADQQIEHNEGEDLAGNFGHGTSVAGIAAGRPNDRHGAGVAPNSVVLQAKVLADSSSEPEWELSILDKVRLIRLAAAHRSARVINMSFGTESCLNNATSAAYAEAVEAWEFLLGELPEPRPVLVAGAGNAGCPVAAAPAVVTDVISVGGLATPNTVWSGSSGDGIDFVALAVNVWTTLRRGPLGNIGGNFGVRAPGTSFAAPQVSGLAALILAEFPSLGAREVEHRIVDLFSTYLGSPCAAPPCVDPSTGYGKIDAERIRTHAGPYRVISDEYSGSPRTSGTWINYQGGAVFLTGGPNGEPTCVNDTGAQDGRIIVRVAPGSSSSFGPPVEVDYFADLATGSRCIDPAVAPDLSQLFGSDGIYKVKITVGNLSGSADPITSGPIWIEAPATSAAATIDFTGSQLLSDATGPFVINIGGVNLFAFNNSDDGSAQATAVSGLASMKNRPASDLTFRFGDIERLSTTTEPENCVYGVDCLRSSSTYGEVDGSPDFFEMLVDGSVVASGQFVSYTTTIITDTGSPDFATTSTAGALELTTGSGALFAEVMALTGGTGIIDFVFPQVDTMALNDPAVSTFSGSATIGP